MMTDAAEVEMPHENDAEALKKRWLHAERLKLLREAIEIERAGGDWTMKQAAAVLGVHLTTLYDIPFLTERVVRVRRRVYLRPADVRLYQAINTGAK